MNDERCLDQIQQKEPNPLAIARALKNLSFKEKLSQEALALRVGKKRSTVANYLRLFSLPQEIQDGIQADKISMGHAKAILSLPDKKKQLALYTIVLKKKLSVRQTEAWAKKEDFYEVSSSHQEQSIFIKDLERQLHYQLGTRVVIEGSDTSGKIMIDYYSLDDLERVVDIFKE